MRTIILTFSFVFTTCMLYAQKNVSAPVRYQLPGSVREADYIPHAIIVKVKPTFREFCNKSGVVQQDLANALQQIKFSSISKIYPTQNKPLMEKRGDGQRLVDLSTIYEIKYDAALTMEEAIRLLLESNTLEYAEPHYLPQVLFTPNDPMKGSQYSLTKMKVFQGWDVSQGDTNVIIGISDTGTDIDHPDLVNSFKYNYDDPIDGQDNDNDGFVDNYRGWDLGENDNNPQVHKASHGAWVSGIAGATVNNGVGVCGIGFKSKLLPCKIDDSTGSLVKAYESIVYLADHGCSIINCSWGSAGGPGQYGQDIVNYAVINNNCLVIAASGNNNAEVYYYPASYDNVLSVGASTSSDMRWEDSGSGTTYNDKIDICAPGQGVYTTDNGGGYITTWGGTSFASPNVAGAAAIVKAQFPNFTGLQVGEQLKATADVIDTLSGNLAYKGKLGAGRVNLYRALTEFNIPSVNVLSLSISDKNNEVFLNGDTLRISAELINYLAPTGNVLATLSSASSNATILDGTTAFNVFATMQKKNNALDPFKVLIHNVSSYNAVIPFTITYQDLGFSRVYNFDVIVNKNYVDLVSRKISTSISSVGRIGYMDNGKDIGLGYLYDGSYNLSGCVGLVVGCSSTQVSDAIFGLSGFNTTENDFAFKKPARIVAIPEFADYQVTGQMNDSIMGVTKVGVKIDYNIYAWDTLADSKYLICEYFIKNMNNSQLSNLYVGLYSDWDITDSDKNAATYDATNKMGYIYSLTSGVHYGALKLLTEGGVRCYSIDNDGDYGSVGVKDGFTSSEKWITLRSNRYNAGVSANHPNGNDVSQLVTTGPLTIMPGDTAKVAFAVITGTSLVDIQNSAIAAQKKYTPPSPDGIVENSLVNKVVLFPNPASDVLTIQVNEKNINYAIYEIVDVLGAVLKKGALRNETNRISINEIAPGAYFVKITAGMETINLKLIKQ